MGAGDLVFEGNLWQRNVAVALNALGPVYMDASTGSPNAYIVTSANVPFNSYTDGQRVAFKANFTNTSAATVNINGKGAVDIVRPDGTALVAGDIASGEYADIVYNATLGDFILLSGLAGGGGFGITSINSLTPAAQTLATGTAGTDFAISSATATHTFNLPVASAVNTGKLSAADWSTFNSKQAAGNYITALTGDVTASGAGSVAATIANDAVSDAKFRQSAGLSVVGRTSNTTGNVADITAGSDAQVLRRSGTSLAFGTVATAGITDAAVTYAKIQGVSAASRLLGRGSAAGSGDVEEITLGTGLSMSSTALGIADFGTWVPTFSANGSMTWTTVSYTNTYIQIGKLVILQIQATGTIGGTPNTSLRFTLPVTADSSYLVGASGGEAIDSAGVVAAMVGFQSSTVLNVRRYDRANWTAGAGLGINVNFIYRAA